MQKRVANQVKRNAALARWGNVPRIERFLKYVQVDQKTQCWLWTGSLNVHGYGQFHDSDRSPKNVHAFRWAYEYFKGLLPTGHEPDHLCRVRRCVNPDHLEAVPGRVNKLRGISPAAINARKTHCIHGHNEWASAGRNGGRRCAACHRENVNRRRAGFSNKQKAKIARYKIKWRNKRRAQGLPVT